MDHLNRSGAEPEYSTPEYYAVCVGRGNVVKDDDGICHLSQRDRPSRFKSKDDLVDECKGLAQPGDEFKIFCVYQTATYRRHL
jgi:hypothetical protein